MGRQCGGLAVRRKGKAVVLGVLGSEKVDVEHTGFRPYKQPTSKFRVMAKQW